jgi:hypothetical protein
MSDEPNMSDNGAGYWKAESIKHERRARKLRDEKGELERAIGEIGRAMKLDGASTGDVLRQLREHVETAEKEWPAMLDELEELRGQRESLAKDPVVAELKKQLATRDRRDEWKGYLKDALVDGVPVEDLWAKAGYEPADEALSEDQYTELVGKAREAAPYLFKPPAGAGEAADAAKASPGNGQAKRPAAGLGGGQGAPDRGRLRVTYTREELMQPGWQKRRPELVEALQAKTAVLAE